MKTKIISIAVAAAMLAASAQALRADEQQASTRDSGRYISTGVGAVAGALVAGPVGFLAGGLIGNLAGRHDAATREAQALPVAETEPAAEPVLPPANPVEQQHTDDVLVVAQAGDNITIEAQSTKPDDPALEDTLLDTLAFDVFFLSGSTAVEAFYQPRIEAIAGMLQHLPDTRVYLDGYSDRRGDSDANLALASERLVAVRDQLVQAGFAAERIQMNALGEQKFLSKPGDLEAYAFDRRVVIRFGRVKAGAESPLISLASESPE